MTCPRCTFENRGSANYCGRCGTSVRAMTLCARCASPNPSSYRFCDVCGNVVTADEAAAGSWEAIRAPVAVAEAGAPTQTNGGQAVAVLDAPAPPDVPGLSDAPVSPDAPPSAPGPRKASAPPKAARPAWASQLTDPQRRALTFTGAAVACLGVLYLQFYAQPTNTAKAIGLFILAGGTGLFGLGAVTSWLPATLRRPCFPTYPPAAILLQPNARIAVAVGSLAFLTLILRLLFGSTAGTDLLLWLVAMAAIGMALASDISFARPTRQHLIEGGAVGLIILVFVALNGSDLNDWYYSVIGDEYAFYGDAKAVLTEGVRRPFTQNGVYSEVPVLNTDFQAAVMAVVGTGHYGWTFSSVLTAALAVPAVYLTGRALAGPAVGIVAAGIFAFCHYVFAFAHIGYSNIMSPVPAAWTMAFFALYMRKPQLWLLYAAGLAGGICFFTYYSARTTMPVIALFVLTLYGWRETLTPRGMRDRLLELWPMVLGYLLGMLPIFAASGTFVITKMFTLVPGGYNADITGPPGQKILTNFWLNVPAFFYNLNVAHYVSGPLLDPISGVLAALGVGLALRWWSWAPARLLLLWIAVALAVTALLSPHPTTAVTRMHVDLPPLALFGALAARHLWLNVPLPSLRRAGVWPQWSAASAVAGLLLLVLALNVQRFWVTTPTKMHLRQEAVVVGALRSDFCTSTPGRPVAVLRETFLLRGALLSYGPEQDLPRLIANPDVKPGQPIPLDDAPCIVFGDPTFDPEPAAMEELRRAHPGSEIQRFTDRAGIGTVMIFVPPRR